MKRKFAVLLGIGVALAIGAAAIAVAAQDATSVCLKRATTAALICPELPSFEPNGGFEPKSLPRHTFAPLRVMGGATIRYGSESALREITIEIDKNGEVEDEGLPTCPRRRLEELDWQDARRACASSLVGTGTANFIFGSEPVVAPLSLFNGAGSSAKLPRLLIQASPPSPFPPIVSAMNASAISHGRFGLKEVLPIPPLDEGQGELTQFKLDIHRLFRFEGKKESYANARCPQGIVGVVLGVRFVGGVSATGDLAFPCTPKE